MSQVREIFREADTLMGLWLLRSVDIGALLKDGTPNLPMRRQMSRWRYFQLAFPRNLIHFTVGAFGLSLKLDPQLQPDVPERETLMVLALWAGLAVIGASLYKVGHPELLLGLIFFWVSPLWLYTLEPFLYPDMVFEWRSYLTVLGIGLVAAALPLYIGWALAAVWAVQSFRRSFAFRSKEAYATQALKENPLAKRQVHNLKLFEDSGAAKKIASLLAEGRPIPPELLALHHPTNPDSENHLDFI